MEILWISCNPNAHRCVPFTGTHNLAKLNRVPFAWGALHQEPGCTIFSTVGKQCLYEWASPRCAHLRPRKLLRLGEVYLCLGEAESNFKTVSGSPMQTHLRLSEAEPMVTRQLHKKKVHYEFNYSPLHKNTYEFNFTH